MKSSFYIVLFLFLFSSKSFAQNGYDVYLHIPASAKLYSIAETQDGGFIGCGSIVDSIDGYIKFYFCRYDKAGNFLWETQIRDTVWTNLTNMNAIDILSNFNNGFIFSGSIGVLGNSTAVVGEIDSTGHLISIFYICDGVHCYGNDLRQYVDSTFIFQSDEFDIGNHHFSPLWRFNQQFDTVWSAGLWFGYGFNDLAVNKSLNTFTMDRGLEYYYSNNYFSQPVVRRISPSGNIDWEFVFTREAYPISYPIFQAIAGKTDNGMVICGTNNLNNNDQIFLLDISPLGDSTGIRHYGSNRYENANNIALCPDGGFIITGSAENDCAPGSRDIFLFKLDTNEDSLWFKTFPGLNSNQGLKVFNTNENGFLIFGNSDSLYRIIKTDSLGNINSSNPYSITTNQSCSVFCKGDTARLTLNLPAATYLWSTGETLSSIQVTQSGYYSVQVTDSNSQVYDVPFLNVVFIKSNNSNLGPDTTFCINNSITLQMGTGFSSYLWQDSSTQSTYTLNSSIPDTFLIYCNALTNGNCNVSDSVTIIYDVCSNISNDTYEEIYFQLYPNPFIDEIEILSLIPINWKLTIGDELGKIVIIEKYYGNKTINVSSLGFGIYFVKIETPKNIFTKKIVKLE